MELNADLNETDIFSVIGNGTLAKERLSIGISKITNVNNTITNLNLGALIIYKLPLSIFYKMVILRNISKQ